jgi:uncharacterized membrane protein YbhN (UPF0104 family)
VTARIPLRKRALSWGLALAALAFVAYAVPIRDQCVDPAPPAAETPAGKAPRVAVSRESGGECVVHRRSAGGDERLAPAPCARLVCEPGLGSTLAAAHILWLVPLLALYFAGTFAWAARWRALLTLAGVRVSVRSTWRITLESQAGGIILPGGFGGDALRIGFVVGVAARQGLPAPTATVAASVLLDRAIGLVTLAAIAAVLAAAFGAGEASLGPATLLLGGIPIAFVVGLVVMRVAYARGLSRAPFLARGILGRVVKPVLEYVGHPKAPGAIARALLISLVVSATQLAVIRGIVFTLAASPSPERWVYVGTTMAFMVGVVPALPGGWGTSDAAFVFFLGRAGLAPSTALAVSLLYRLFWYSSGGVGALLFVTRGSRATEPAPDGQRADPS